VSQVTWYAARAAGLIAWCLLAASVAWGLALSTGIFGRRPRPAWLLDLHRFLGAAAVVFVGVHVIALLADDYVHFAFADVLVPLRASWHPVAVAWGVVAAWLLAAVEITSLLRSRISAKLWRRTHYASFGVFVLATLHGVSAGTDRHALLFVWAVVVGVALVSALSAIRVSATGDARTRGARGTTRPARAALAARSNATAPRSAR
jgi:hypothetical protein